MRLSRDAFKLPDRKEITIVAVLNIIFLLVTGVFIGLRIEHIFLLAVIDLLFLSSDFTRKMLAAMFPFVLFGLSYDYMRLYPNYMVNDIDIEALYNADKALFGVMDDGVKVTLSEYFSTHHTPVLDFISGFSYLCWVPVPIAFGFLLFFLGKRKVLVHFTWGFLFVNLIGFAGYYIYPAAPPWYVMEHSFEPVFNTMGSAAGLSRFDDLLGVDIFTNMYVRNANVFAAIPSLHSAYMTIAFIYAIIAKCNKWLIFAFGLIMCGIWFGAVYTAHHYVIDVLLGISCAVFGLLLFEFVILRIPWFSKRMESLVKYVS